jgi:hypothetical protein
MANLTRNRQSSEQVSTGRLSSRTSRVGVSSALLVFAVFAAACSTSVPASQQYRPLLGTTMLVDARATPPRWVPIDFGYAQLSVPPTWQVSYGPAAADMACPAQAPGLLAVDEPWIVTIPYGVCNQHLVGLPPTTDYVVLGPPPTGVLAGSTTRINGFTVSAQPGLRRIGSHSFQVFVAPELGVSIAISGPSGEKVLHTITASPRAEVLSQTSLPAVPQSWHWRSVDGLSFATPAPWPAESSDVTDECDNSVALGSEYVLRNFVYEEPVDRGGHWTVEVLPDRPQVFVDSDEEFVEVLCPARSGSSESVPGEGLRVDTGVRGLESQSMPRLHVGGLQIAVDDLAALDILTLLVTVRGRPDPIEVSIGLGDSQVASEIISSLRAAG